MFTKVAINGIMQCLIAGSAPLSASAHEPMGSKPDAQVDAVYLALGQGDIVKAAAASAALLVAVTERDPRRGIVLHTRLDVLDQRHELDKPEGVALLGLIQHFANREPRGDALARLFAITAAYDKSQAQESLAQIQKALAVPGTHSTQDIADLRFAQARAAALINGELEQAGNAARLARDAWRKLRGLCSAWHQVQLDYIIGNVYDYTGSKSQALAQFETASRFAIASFGADSASRIKIDTLRASVLVELGRNSEALALRESVLIATRQRFGEHTIEAAKAEASIGAGLQEIGDYAAASVRYIHAEQTLATLTNPPARDRGVIAMNYGNLLQEMGEEKAALEHYHQALAVWGEDPQLARVRAATFANIGNTEFRFHHYEDAIADFQRALALREQSDGKNAAGLAYSLEGLGSSALALKHYADAEQYFARALEVRGRALPPNHPTLAVFNFGLALAHWGQGQSDEAFRYAQLTAENQHAMLSAFATDFSERQSVVYRDILVPATALAVTLAAQRGDAASIASAWRLAMVERGLVERAQAHRLAAARSANDPELAKAFTTWRHANSALGEAWLSPGTTPERMAQLRADTENAERALWHQSGRDPGTALAKSMEITAMAQTLPADGLLIAFSEGIGADSATLLAAGDKPAPEDWYAFALGANAQPTLRRVGNIQALSAQVRAWYQDLRSPAADVARLRRNGLALRQTLLDPIVALAAQRRVFIVPEGELFRLSFAALPDNSQGYLIETGTRVHTLAHETELMLPMAPPHAEQTLLAGAPDFPGATEATAMAQRQLCLRATRQGFAAIPNAARELNELQQLMSAASPTSQITLLDGAGATKANVLAALPRATIVHLATHGFSLDESCGDDGSMRAKDGSDTALPGASQRGVTLDRPQTAAAGIADASFVSGLAFSGASVTPGSAPVGVLSAGEMGTLDLSHLDWVALSACDSGLGPIGRNEGVFGMRRALRLAGARTVVMSLWQVDDAATADLMQNLYRARFLSHDDVPDAMAKAMRGVIAARRAHGESDQPYFWAAFISEGGWR